MNTTFQHIREKINNIQHGLIRFRDEQIQVSFLAKVVADDDGWLICIIDEALPRQNLLNRHVSLVQKRHFDFLYIVGKVSAEVKRNSRVVSIKILKASWFVRKARGHQSWFEAKHIFISPNKKNGLREYTLPLK